MLRGSLTTMGIMDGESRLLSGTPTEVGGINFFAFLAIVMVGLLILFPLFMLQRYLHCCTFIPEYGFARSDDYQPRLPLYVDHHFGINGPVVTTTTHHAQPQRIDVSPTANISHSIFKTPSFKKSSSGKGGGEKEVKSKEAAKSREWSSATNRDPGDENSGYHNAHIKINNYDENYEAAKPISTEELVRDLHRGHHRHHHHTIHRYPTETKGEHESDDEVDPPAYRVPHHQHHIGQQAHAQGHTHQAARGGGEDEQKTQTSTEKKMKKTRSLPSNTVNVRKQRSYDKTNASPKHAQHPRGHPHHQHSPHHTNNAIHHFYTVDNAASYDITLK